MASNGEKQTLGRQKIELKKIEKKSSREVTFAKRRQGLFGKASELSILTGAETAVITFSPRGKAYPFGHPSVDKVIDRYLFGNAPDTEINNSSKINEIKSQYGAAVVRLEEEKMRSKAVRDLEGGGFWWEDSVEELELEELERYAAAVEALKRNVVARVGELESESNLCNSPSSFLASDSGEVFDDFAVGQKDGHGADH